MDEDYGINLASNLVKPEFLRPGYQICQAVRN